MKPLAAIMLLLALTGLARAATTPPACASLCGDWRLDATASDKPEQLLDAAFLQFKEPKARRQSIPNTDNLEALRKAADEDALGPILSRPRSRELREELELALRQPRSLIISGNAEDIRIAGDGSSSMGITPGEHSSRVDRYGTARIESRWRGSQLAVREKYDRRNQQETTYSTGSDGALRVTQVIARPGLPRITVRSVYRKP
ncbi:MAG: hypothetical protein IPM70_09350 [Proteobacteria bacterium]|nr:hypothetical protein [Pseudomonadota bacterium]MCC6633793.1 hypothetical protein [Gammaproteobacteria bacterium]